MTTLKQGDKGSSVVQLQKLLNAQLKPSPKLVEDGDFGAKTKAAVVQFQRANSLTPDGIVGPLTWAKLQGSSSSAPSAPSYNDNNNAPWLKLAEAEIGTVEDKRPGQHTSRIVEYHKTTTLKADTDEVPWCSSFVNWVMEKAGYSGTDSAAAMSWLDWGKKITDARPGAIAVIKKKTSGSDASTGSTSGYHVGFLIEASPSSVRLLGGNQSDQVKYSNFSLSSYSVQGYRWPA